MDVDIPSFKTYAVSCCLCKATRVERRGAVSESSTQLSCLGWDPALSLDPHEGVPGTSHLLTLPTLRCPNSPGSRIERMCVCVLSRTYNLVQAPGLSQGLL